MSADALNPTYPAAASRSAARRAGLKRSLRGSALRWLSPLAILLAWQLASATGLLPEKTLAAPAQIAQTTWDLLDSGQLTEALSVSLRRALVGLAIGTVAALALGTIAGLSRLGDAIVDPPMQMVRTLPLFGLVPLFILWFGIGEAARVKVSDVVPVDGEIVARQQALADLLFDERVLPSEVTFTDIVDSTVVPGS